MKNSLKEKTDKLAITCFVISLIPALTILFPQLVPFRDFENIFPSVFLFYLPILLSIVFGIIAIIRIRKNKSLKGENFAIIGIIISVLIVLIVITSIFFLLNSLNKW